jgi:ABC-type amino acid transport substrate-binding protein
VCREVVAEVRKVLGRDVAVEYVAVTAENRFTALPDNVIDLLCAATTRTIARGEQVDFTLPTFVSGGSFMTLAGSDIRNNFGGKKIGVVKNTTTVAELRRLLADAKVDAQVVELDATSQGVSALEKREIDAFAADQVVLIGLALAAQGPPGFTVLPDVFSFEPFALAVRRNDADFRLVADRVLARLCRSRDIQKIYDAWFGSFAPRRSPAFDALVHFNAIPE